MSLAVIGAGGIITGSNPGYTSLELGHHLQTSHAKFIVAEPQLINTVLETVSQLGLSIFKLFVFDTAVDSPFLKIPSWKTLLEHGEHDWCRFENPEIDKQKVATLAFSSGTTGLPKAAMISHAFHVSQVWTLRSQGKPYQVSRLLCLPAFHMYGLPLISGCAIYEGHTVYLMRRFEVGHFIECISRYQITETAIVPAMALSIINSQCSTAQSLYSLRYVWSAGSPLRRSTQAALQSLLSQAARVVQVWGMTELGWVTAFFWPEADDTGSVGRPLPGMSIKLVDDSGTTVEEDGVDGEMLVRGSCMMSGYLDNPNATAETMDADGWLKTGDIAYRKDEKWYIVDRKKDLLKVRGWQVSPAEIEAVLLTHPNVAEAAVVGVQSTKEKDMDSEVPQAYVVCKERQNREEKGKLEGDIKSLVASKLARYKHLEGGVRFISAVPRNASGKILRHKLRALNAGPYENGSLELARLDTTSNPRDVPDDSKSERSSVRRLSRDTSYTSLSSLRGSEDESADDTDDTGRTSPELR